MEMAHPCPLVRVGGVYLGGNRPFAFRAFKEKGDLLLAGTVCVEVWGLVETGCAIPSTDPGLEWVPVNDSRV